MHDLSHVPDETKETYLRAHLEARYGVEVVGLQRLDRGVFDTRFQNGRRWIVRVFPASRPMAQVEGDAAFLQFLEHCAFPAERCADASPVSCLHGRGILVTQHVGGSPVDATESTACAFGQMLARLAMLSAGGDAVARPAGALHHYVQAGGTVQQELDAAAAWLAALDESVPTSSCRLYDSLRAQLAEADTCADLPEALIHPDPVLRNLLASDGGSLTLIDWTGAGRGPRLFALAVAVWSCALAKGTWSPAPVDALVAGYRSVVPLQSEEMRRLAGVMRIRPLVFACWRFRHAITSGRAPDGSEWWWPSERLVEAVAARACTALQTP